jgi:protein SCO1
MRTGAQNCDCTAQSCGACIVREMTRAAIGIWNRATPRRGWVFWGCVALLTCQLPQPQITQLGLKGRVLDQPISKIDFTLPSADGRSFAFRKETEGYVTLLFFGYTYCPDVCPVHMANLASVLRKLPPEQAAQIKVVFVTTDPERDTPERLRTWLGYFDRRFVGLVGSLEQVNEIQHRLGLGAAYREVESSDGAYGVAHAAQVIAFTRDNLAHVVYPFGTRQSDWAHDLPKLVTTSLAGP